MSKTIGILFFLCLLLACGGKEETKKTAPGATAPVAGQSQDEHISGDETSTGHVSGAPSPSDSHVSGN